MGDVGLVDALVADVAVAEVPEPVPVVMEQVAVERALGGRPEPEVEVERSGRGSSGLMPIAPARLADIGLARPAACPTCPACSGGDFGGPAFVAALLGAVLHDAAVLGAASTHLRPSKIVWLHGFSTYTSLPAWQPQMVSSECQWLGVAIEMASRSLSSRALRMS